MKCNATLMGIWWEDEQRRMYKPFNYGAEKQKRIEKNQTSTFKRNTTIEINVKSIRGGRTMGELIFWTGIGVMIVCFFIEYADGD
jgi:hypothetical protein